MAEGKSLEYRLIVKDDMTATLKKVGAEVESLKKKMVTLSTGEKVPEGWGDPLKRGFTDISVSAKKAGDEINSFDRIIGRINRTIIAFFAVWAFREVLGGFKSLVETGVRFNATMEDARLGVASIFMAQGSFVTMNRVALQGAQALGAAYQMADGIIKQLQLDNLQTKATFEQLVKAYQQTLAPGLEVGLDPNQIRQYTVAMVQAAGALGLNLDMLAEETRSMLRGAITPRNTLIATALGIRNEDIARYKSDADALYAYIMGRLSSFAMAGMESQKTFMGMATNIKDAFSIVLGKGLEPFFNYLKTQMSGIMKYLVTPTEMGLQPNEEAVGITQRIGSALIATAETAKEAGTWLSKFAPSLELAYEAARFFYVGLIPIALLLKFIGDQLNLGLDLNAYSSAQAKDLLKTYNDWALGVNATTIALEKMQKAIPSEVVSPHIEARYVPIPPRMKEEEMDAAIKLRIAIGDISEEDKKRIELMNKEVFLFNDINKLSEAQLASLSKISREWEKASHPEVKALFPKLAAHENTKIIIEQELAMAKVNLQIAESTKNYAKQAELIGYIGQKERERLLNEGKLPPALDKIMQTYTNWKKVLEERKGMIETLGFEEEILGAKAAMSGMSGDIENQVKLEEEILDKTIKRRILSLDLKGGLADEVELYLKAKQAAEGIQKIEQNRLEYQTRLNTAVSGIADITGNYREQAIQVWKAHEANLANLAIQGKLVGVEGAVVATAEDRLASLKMAKIMLEGESELTKKRLDLEIRLAEAAGDTEAVYSLQNKILQEEIKSIQFIINALTSEDNYLKAQLQGIVNLMKEVGPSEQARRRTTDLVSSMEKLADLRLQFSELGGSVEEVEENYDTFLMLQKVRISLDPNLIDSYDQLADLLDKIAGKQKEARAFQRLADTANLRKEVAELSGEWERSKLAEEELLKIELDRKMALETLSSTTKSLLSESYNLKMKELEAQRTLNTEELMNIGVRKGTMRFTQEFVDAFEKAIPEAISSSTNALGNFLVELGTKGTADIQSFLNAFHQGLVQIIMDLAMVVLRLQIVKAVGGVLMGGVVNTGGVYNAAGIPVTEAHSGGVMGSVGLVSRTVPPSLFIGAPRLHSGLLAGEFPAILQRGEKVTPRGGGGEPVNVTVINQSSSQIDVKSDSNSGGRDISILVSEIAGAEVGKFGSPLNKGIRQVGGRNMLIRR